jgi:hypothetical protein
MNLCSNPSNDNKNIQTPYEKRLFSSVNGGSPLSCPRLDATDEYHSNTDEVIKYSYYLVKGSKFKNNESNDVSILHEDIGIQINGRMKVKYGDSYMIVGLNTKDSIEVTSPIISIGGFGVKTNGTYNITLVEESKIRVSKNEKVVLFGSQIGEIQTFLNITLNEDMIGTYISNLSIEEKKKEEEVKQTDNLRIPQIIPNFCINKKPVSFNLSIESNVESKLKNNNIDKMLDQKLQERELDDEKILSKLSTGLNKESIPSGSVTEKSKESMEYLSAEELREKIKEIGQVSSLSLPNKDVSNTPSLEETSTIKDVSSTAPKKVLLTKELLAKLQS